MSDATDHADAFAALSDPTRVAILRALWEHEESAVSFSALRAAVGTEDSGRFNYHLGKLTDEFVTKTETGGYRLRRAGYDLVGSILAGTYDYETGLGPIPFDEPCPLCGGPMEVTYDGEYTEVECVSDDRPETVTVQLPMPQSVFQDDDQSAVSDTVRAYARSLVADVRSGFCIHCEAPTSATVRSRPGDSPDDAPDVPLVETTCDHCGDTNTLNLGVYLTDHPAVVSFYYEHGTHVRDLSLTETIALGDDCPTVTDEDHVHARVRYTADGDTLDLTVDESATVLTATRSDDTR